MPITIFEGKRPLEMEERPLELPQTAEQTKDASQTRSAEMPKPEEQKSTPNSRKTKA